MYQTAGEEGIKIFPQKIIEKRKKIRNFFSWNWNYLILKNLFCLSGKNIFEQVPFTVDETH